MTDRDVLTMDDIEPGQCIKWTDIGKTGLPEPHYAAAIRLSDGRTVFINAAAIPFMSDMDEEYKGKDASLRSGNDLKLLDAPEPLGEADEFGTGLFAEANLKTLVPVDDSFLADRNARIASRGIKLTQRDETRIADWLEQHQGLEEEFTYETSEESPHMPEDTDRKLPEPDANNMDIDEADGRLSELERLVAEIKIAPMEPDNAPTIKPWQIFPSNVPAAEPTPAKTEFHQEGISRSWDAPKESPDDGLEF